MIKILKSKVFRSDLFQNAVALYGVQICRKVAPLVTVPYLARVLGAGGWGAVAFALSIGMFLVIWVEFGFPLSATREVARTRESHEDCVRVVSGVAGVQILLCLVGLVGILLAAPILPIVRDRPLLLGAGAFFGFAQGLTPFWFFQGMERLKTAAFLDMTGKLVGMSGILLFVHTPSDDWKAIMLQALGPLVTTCAGYFLIFRQTTPRWPTSNDLRTAFFQGWPFFLYRLATGLNGTANVFILGLFAPVQAVGYFASAEKISTAALGLLNPIHEAFYPRISHLASRALEKAARLARIGGIVMCGGGVVLATALLLLAQPIIGIAMGPGFEPAVPVLRIMALMILLGSLANVTAMQWLLPIGHHSTVNRIVIRSGCLNLVLACVFGAMWSYVGVAWAAVISELYMVSGLLLATSATLPFWNKQIIRVGAPPRSCNEIV